MNKGLVALAVTSYNGPKHMDGLLRSFVYQTYMNYKVVIADDGSTDNTVEVAKSFSDSLPLEIMELEHGERGIARAKSIKKALEYDPEFLVILDGDMMLAKNFLTVAVDAMEANEEIDGLALEEVPYSNYTNFFTRVKIFERKVLNNSRTFDREHSIEAARFWRTDSYLSTGGINEKQIAFEEIQPTLRCLDQGGSIEKLFGTYLYHDEKKATLRSMLKKKDYYFSKLPITMEGENEGFLKTLQRWYLFRPVYYTSWNIKLYFLHPLLFLGMIWMYVCLSFIGVYHVMKHYLKKFFQMNRSISS